MALATDNQWHAAPNTTDGDVLGRTTSAKVAFFGGTPVVKPTVPLTTPTVQQVITALVALGLIRQSD